MNKYTELSDFEINKKVANLVLNGYYIASEEKQEIYLATMDGGDFLPIAYFDPCDNPSNAMPIIIENKIAIFPMNALGVKYWCAASDFKDIGEKEIVWGLESNNQNPLRAAMELFLMLKDAENEG